MKNREIIKPDASRGSLNSTQSNNLNKQSNYSDTKQRLDKLYRIEFVEGTMNILIDPETTFIQQLLSRIKFSSNEILGKLSEEKDIKDYIKNLDDQIIERYTNLKRTFTLILTELKRNPNLKVEGLTRFRKHCINCPDIPNDLCKQRIIIIKENDIKYVICVGCKKVFNENSIILQCNFCNVEYFSGCVSSESDMNLQPATWKNYHCGALYNEQMRCIDCKEPLFIRLNDNMVFCKNCKFNSVPTEIAWVCIFCKGDFTTGVKIYNQLEFKLIKNAIRDSLIKKVPAKPRIVPCCGTSALKMAFKHKSNCQNDIYYGELNSKEILVCSKCKTLMAAESYVWNCTLCNSKFQDIENKTIEHNSPNIHEIKNFKDEGSPKIEPQVSRRNSGFVEESAPYIKKNKAYFDKKNDSDDIKKRNNSVYRYSNPNSGSSGSQKKVTENNLHQINENEEENSVRKKSENEETQNYNQMKKHYQTDANKAKMIHSKTLNNEVEINEFKIENEYEIKKMPSMMVKDYRRGSLQEQKSNISMAGHSAHRNKTDLKNSREDNPGNKNENPKINLPTKIQNNSNLFIGIPKNLNKHGSSNKVIDVNPNNANNFNLNINKINLKSSNGQSSPTSNKDSCLTPKLKQNYNLENFSIEDLKVIQSVGEGSFGVIYSCENIFTKEKYALKKIIVNSDEDLALFTAEYEMVKKINHKHILNIYGICKRQLDFSTQALYILMELATSDWDKEIKSRERRLMYYSENELILFLKQIVNSLYFLQTSGISHRDIKPQNILIFPNNLVKVADFGEAKIIRNDKRRMETLRGTELYMSPILFSALRGGENNNVQHNVYKSDVYSLGYCLLYASTLSYKILYELRTNLNQKNVNIIIKNYLSKKFSQKFIDLLGRMLDLSEINRYDFIELNSFLNENF